MRAAKFAISIPAETMREVDRAAKRLQMTRSRYIAVVLARIAKDKRDRSISKKVDDVLATLREQELGFVHHLNVARRDEGTEW
jgi:metal-responsive CopG/Arc/MetJ family transcriptional regulator